LSDSNKMAEGSPEQVVAEPDPLETAPLFEAPADEPVVQQDSIGQQLRAARLEAKLTITDVAQALKFSPRQIELLEQDAHAALPGMTIVRGFVRSYSRMLKLDTDALLKLLDASSPVVMADVRPPDNMGVAGTEGDRQQIGPVVSLAIVVLLAALMLAGWHFFGPKPATSSHPTATATPATITPMPQGTLQPVPSDAAPGLMPPATQALGLTFVFEDRSWLEVVDADAKVLHSAENLAGTQLSLTGKPPFDLVIGNAAKVKLTYGERVIDLLPHTRADVARLKVE
jgi:cytoskeleton protein RodZ